jgi:sugar phosphate isomerase/epimerase
MKIAFSKPTRDDVERQMLFSRFRSFGYDGLQLKHAQYSEYIDQPARFVGLWGTDAADIASGLITAGRLDTAGIAELRKLFRFAQAVGTERIIFCHSQPRQGLTSADIKGFAKILSELGREAQQYGTSLSLHHHYNQPVMYRQDFETFFEAVDDQSVKLTVDTAHLIKSGINDIGGVLRDIADGEFKVLGQGTIDFTSVFAALQEIGFAGWVCADEESGSDLLEAMEICAQVCYRIRHSAEM